MKLTRRQAIALTASGAAMLPQIVRAEGHAPATRVLLKDRVATTDLRGRELRDYLVKNVVVNVGKTISRPQLHFVLVRGAGQDLRYFAAEQSKETIEAGQNWFPGDMGIPMGFVEEASVERFLFPGDMGYPAKASPGYFQDSAQKEFEMAGYSRGLFVVATFDDMAREERLGALLGIGST